MKIVHKSKYGCRKIMEDMKAVKELKELTLATLLNGKLQ
jgi:hypothetical protein